MKGEPLGETGVSQPPGTLPWALRQNPSLTYYRVSLEEEGNQASSPYQAPKPLHHRWLPLTPNPPGERAPENFRKAQPGERLLLRVCS